jgi:hypothetical protein
MHQIRLLQVFALTASKPLKRVPKDFLEFVLNFINANKNLVRDFCKELKIVKPSAHTREARFNLGLINKCTSRESKSLQSRILLDDLVLQTFFAFL